MHDRQQRARRRPGPLLFTALCISLAMAATVVRAHDPGLSSLDVSVRGTAITASLSISAADVALLAPGGKVDAQQALRELTQDSVHVAVGDETLPLLPLIPPIPLIPLIPLFNEEIETGAGGVRIRLSFASPRSSPEVRRLTVTSDLPMRLARGHRELLVVTVDGRVVTERVLDAEANSVVVDLVVASPSEAGKAWSFLTLGVRHILSGYDHLVFLAGLILAACTVRELLLGLTAFTAAHSVSLALVVIAGVHAPPAIVEPLIAASIAWVGIENLLRGRHRSRWWIVFGFGLVHGFGFAGALMELGFGSSARDVALALLSFNGGVEAGQLVAAAAMLPLVWIMRSRRVWQARLVPLCSMLIVGAGGYWLIERLW